VIRSGLLDLDPTVKKEGERISSPRVSCASPATRSAHWNRTPVSLRGSLDDGKVTMVLSAARGSRERGR
jgi:hypothetical protein